MGQTVTEKIISARYGQAVTANDFIVIDVDRLLLSDTTAPIAIRSFLDMGGRQVHDPDRVILFLDHATPSPTQNIANLHTLVRKFALEQGLRLHDVGDGVCHQVMIEAGYAQPGDVIFGADSHTCTYGGIGAFSTGIGSTDAAAVMLTGKIWMKVPASIKVAFHGQLANGVSGKDVALYLARLLGANGANYLALEYVDQDQALSAEDRLCISNMAIEVGAKCGVFSGASYAADADASYVRCIGVELSAIEPLVACPHQVYLVKPARELSDVAIQQVFIGGCTNGRYSDLCDAANVLAGKSIPPDVRLLVSPASRQVLKQAVDSGVLSRLIEAGAAILTPGCNACVGTLGGVPGDGENVISTTNRNFVGRMGNNKAFIYLASAATAAASALCGRICDPRQMGEKA